MIYPRDRLEDLIANDTDGIYLPFRNVATVWSLSLPRIGSQIIGLERPHANAALQALVGAG
jgi:hypothetical protein